MRFLYIGRACLGCSQHDREVHLRKVLLKELWRSSNTFYTHIFFCYLCDYTAKPNSPSLGIIFKLLLNLS